MDSIRFPETGLKGFDTTDRYTTATMSQTESWKTVSSFSNYKVSSFGRLRNVMTGKYVGSVNAKHGYMEATLSQDGKSQKYYVHVLVAKHFIPNPANKKYVDHKNHNKADNRVSNLRWVSHQENLMNKRKTASKCLSKYKGVSYNKQANKYVVSIGLNGKPKYLGLFLDEKLAAHIYNKAAKKHFGQYAHLNDISDSEDEDDDEYAPASVFNNFSDEKVSEPDEAVDV